LEELASRYSGNMSDIPVPELPEWCLEGGEDGEGGGGDEERSGRDGGPRKRRRELQKENATFAVSVPGVSVVLSPVREEVQRRCQDILNWEGSGFPGSQPVSMDKKNLQLLRTKPYRVSWKADGTRCENLLTHSLTPWHTSLPSTLAWPDSYSGRKSLVH
jgi:mRNA-capping enzyme